MKIAIGIFVAAFSFALSTHIVLVTPAKSGTHMLLRCIKKISAQRPDLADDLHLHGYHFCEVLRKSPQILFETLQKPCSDYRLIIHTRDPRDVLISFENFVSNFPAWYPWTNNEFPATSKFKKTFEDVWSSASRDERIALLLDGYWPRPLSEYRNDLKLASYFYSLHKKKDTPFVLFTRFENLVGPNGGGSWELQIQEVKKIADFLGYELSDSEIHAIANDLFGKTNTFRHGLGGTIGRWKNRLSPGHKACFKENYQTNLELLDYESSSDW